MCRMQKERVLSVTDRATLGGDDQATVTSSSPVTPINNVQVKTNVSRLEGPGLGISVSAKLDAQLP